MGATTYRLMSGFAVELADDPGVAALTAMPKVVFSSTSGGTTLVGQHRVGRRGRRRNGEGHEAARPATLRTIGSLSVCRSLLASRCGGPLPCGRLPGHHGATGKERIFDGYPDVALDLVESRTFDGRLQLLEYVPTVLDGPPGVGDWPE